MSRAAKVRVNREDELALFEHMAAGVTRERILLVRANSGMGKSEFLREIIARRPPSALVAPLDFKNGDVPDLAELFSRVCAHLSLARFPILAAKIAQFASGAINITENTIWGQAEITVAMSGPDEDTRKFRRAALTDAFLSDLRSAGKVVLVFDTFNACDPLLAQWFSGFVARLGDAPNLTIVVAGQHVPEPTLEWETFCHFLPLGAMAPKHWLEYAQAIGLKVSLDWVEGCWHACEGHSLKIALYLESKALQEQVA